MNQYEIDKSHMIYVYEYAMDCSHDPDTKSGCKIVMADNESYVLGANTIPSKIKIEPFMLDKPQKYLYIEHAERDAICKCAEYGIEIKNSTLYINWIPCSDCSRAIINSGIKRVVIHKEGQETYERLAKENKGGDWHEIDSIEFMRSAGIQVDYLPMDFGGEVKARFRGVDVTL